ncbi:hypothetical protein PRZ48_002100 [Zasmidium cellare]|uniref:GP-PDE domain-containing protein n=1 Tax=Zasmidium cellare TaxID=395010 RepID=A0ABR0F330_ZASCE|nr:hypothetical protein PRZ48_002100 [Zasmidium cellare]
MPSDTTEQPSGTRPTVVPPVVVQPGVEKLDSPVSIPEDTVFPAPTFAKATLNKRKRRTPQCIAHRGYKARFPENSILGFEEAVKAGATGLETDVHFTKDGVVVISHDSTLRRCFGRKDKILDRTWDEIKDLRTTSPPHVPMPRMEDLLDFLTRPGMEEIWVLVDIKLDNDAEDIMRLLGATMARVKQPPGGNWRERIVLGLWAAKYLPLAAKYLPGFPVLHIGFKTSYARHFHTVPNVGFNMLLPMLIAPGGLRFVRESREVQHRQVLAWTVNDKDRLEWCLRHELDGVVTDDPAIFARMREEFDQQSTASWMSLSIRTCLEVLRVYIGITCMFWLFRRRRRFGAADASPDLIQKVPR